LNEETKLIVGKFINGLLPSVTNKVDLQCYLSFDDVCNLDIEIKTNLMVTNPSKRLPTIARKTLW